MILAAKNLFTIIVIAAAFFESTSAFAQASTPAFYPIRPIRNNLRLTPNGPIARCRPGQPDRAAMLTRSRTIRAEIATASARRDVESNVNDLRSAINQCQFTADEIGASEATLLRWRDQGLMFAMLNEASRLQATAVDGRYNSRDTSYYMSLSERLGQTLAAEDAFLAQLAATSVAAQREQQSCTPVDLGASFGRPRNQDSVGWCFGFAASELLSFKTGRVISAADTSLAFFNGQQDEQNAFRRFASGDRETTLRAGYARAALERSLDRGLCLESRFRSEDNGANGIQRSLDRIIDIRDGLLPLRPACQDDLEKANRIFPTLSMTQLNLALVSSVETSFISRLARTACGQRIANPGLRVRDADLNPDARGPADFTPLDRQLSARNPVVLSLRSQVLSSPESGNQAVNHAVTVIGRRYNSERNRCEYLIRDSSRPSCSSFNRSFECGDSEKGHTWVPKSVLSGSARNATYLE